MPSLNNAVVLVTGANGGLGTHFVTQALERGASKVYATARHPREWADPRVIPLVLDVTDPASIAAAAAAAPDVTVLINNAGIANGAAVLGPQDDLRKMFEANFFGPLAVVDAFRPALARSAGTVLNVASVLSWLGIAGGYSASKAALWQATNSLRIGLAEEGITVTALHLGYTDTPMTAAVDAPKNDPAEVVRIAYDGLESGAVEILADDVSRQVKAALAGPVESLYPELVRG